MKDIIVCHADYLLRVRSLVYTPASGFIYPNLEIS